MERLASVLAPELRAEDDLSPTRRLAAALLAGSPRVMAAGPGLCRVDARGWGRRGGEEALARTLGAAAREEGLRVRVGVAGAAVVADVAARVAGDPRLSALARRSLPGPPRGGGDAGESPGGGDLPVLVVPDGEARSFLAPLPLRLLPLGGEMRETLRALGLRRIGEVAGRDRSELESRFGPAGLRLHRWARGEDDRLFRPLTPDEPPEARMELEGGVRSVEPLLFVLRRLLARLCGELEEGGWHLGRLRLRLGLEEGGGREVTVSPARPTRREGLLFELCRAALERTAEGDRLPAPVASLTLRALERRAPEVRQRDLFATRQRDPADAAGALSRIRARLGDEAVVRPAPRPRHRPEARSGWEAAEAARGGETPAASSAADGGGSPAPPAPDAADPPLPGVLHLLPEPDPVRVEPPEGPPRELWDGERWHELAAAEGPERLSGDWWKDLYRREYWRVCTGAGELLWVFREWRRGGEPAWKLHGWWD